MIRFLEVAAVMIAACLGSVYLINRNIQEELAPMEDRDQFRINLSGLEGTSFDYMDTYVDHVTQFVIDSVPEYKTAVSFSNLMTAMIVALLYMLLLIHCNTLSQELPVRSKALFGRRKNKSIII